ncbi:MAG: ABC transporter permease [Bacteroidales bacterium]|nr:ABC transporter permease [Bacteroidales bacterium]
MQELWQEIWQTIKRNKWRSFMTAFGVFWGLLMLILLVGFGHGIFNGIVGQLNVVPSNSIFFGSDHTSMPYKGFNKNRSFDLDNVDVDILQANLGERVRFITPINFAGSKTCCVGEYKYDSRIIGTRPCYMNVMPQQLIYGRYLNDIDLMEHRKVCVIGKRVYDSLFPKGGDPSGQMIKVGGIYYTIVGVVKKLSEMINIGSDINQSLILPVTTVQQTYNQGNTLHIICLTLHDQYPAAEWQERALSYCKEHHTIHPDDKSAFWCFNLAEILSMFNGLFVGINILLWIVGCGSLLAGLIGISNIMLVTVKERTQEIGIRRALGAKPVTIVTQILAESITLTSIAGLAGFMAGVWILALVDTILQAQPPSDDGFSMQSPQIPFSVAVSAMIVIIVGGVWAGWMPAKRAMKIKAIEALREE